MYLLKYTSKFITTVLYFSIGQSETLQIFRSVLRIRFGNELLTLQVDCLFFFKYILFMTEHTKRIGTSKTVCFVPSYWIVWYVLCSETQANIRLPDTCIMKELCCAKTWTLRLRLLCLCWYDFASAIYDCLLSFRADDVIYFTYCAIYRLHL